MRINRGKNFALLYAPGENVVSYHKSQEGFSVRYLFRQRFFSWFDSYDIYDETGRTAFVVKGRLSWGHLFKVYDGSGTEIGMIREKILTLLPQFIIYKRGVEKGRIRKRFTLLRPVYEMGYRGWHIEGDWFEWNYTIVDDSGRLIAGVSKELFHFTDHYAVNVVDISDAEDVMLFIVAMDAEKCSRERARNRR